MATTIVLVRHGETDWNRQRRFQGQADPPLNALGRAAARQLAEELAGEPVVAVYSSPLRRALETARILGSALRLDVAIEERLREIDVGSWQGVSRSDVESRFPDGYARWLAGETGWEGGETYSELADRVCDGLQAIARRHEGLVVAVTHGGPIRSALRAAGIASGGPSIGNCATVRLVVREGGIEAVD